MANLKKCILYGIVFIFVICGCHATKDSEIKQSILDQKIALDEKGVLWQVPNERVESGISQKIFPYQDDFLLFGSVADKEGQYSTKATIISGETGEVLAERDCSEFETPSIGVCHDSIFLSDWDCGLVQFLDEKLKVTWEYRFQNATGSIYAGENGEKLYCFTANDGIHIVDRAKKTKTILLQDKAMNLYPSVKCGNNLSFGYLDTKTQLSVTQTIDLNTSEIETIPFDGAFYAVEKNEGIWLAERHGEDDVYYIGRNRFPKTFSLQSKYGVASITISPSRMIVSDYGKNGLSAMTLYAMDGSFLSTCALDFEDGILTSEMIWSEKDGGYFFVITAKPGKDILLFWDVSIPMTGTSLTFTPVKQEEKRGAVSHNLYEKAKALSEKYGIEVLIAEQGNFDAMNWKIGRVYDEALIEEALGHLENALAAYPDGFMEQLRYGTKIKTQILLGGGIEDTNIPQNSAGFTTYVGFAIEGAGGNVAAVDITTPGQLEQVIHHEIMHLVDYRLTFDAQIREDALYSEKSWAELNPPDFTYPNKKYDLPLEIYKEGYEEYFMDLYARTTSSEDRARIMEYAMVGADWRFSSSPARLEKLKYLSDCIRDAFDTTGWPEETQWEHTFNEAKR